MRTIDLNDVRRLGWRVAWGTALLAAAPAVVGCQQRGGPAAAADKDLTGIPGEQFTPSDEPRHMHRVLDAQAASGARGDATLRACHFDAGRPAALNSLGEEKLALMMDDDDALPLVVHVDAAGDEPLSAARQQSVKVYLRDRGLADQQVTVVNGRNAGTYAPTAPRVKTARDADAKATAVGQGTARTTTK
jgi:hypothetical protein